MIVKATILWVLGLLTLVPWAVWYLFFQATRDQYALFIVLPLFWVFGYWGVVGPLIGAIKVRQVFRAIEMAGSRDELLATLRSDDAREVAIDLIASENHIPRFLAARVYKLLADRLASPRSGAVPPA
jgi:hypothetical protein